MSEMFRHSQLIIQQTVVKNKMKDPVLIIAGPTASGKKKLALECADRFNGEIVSADSRKVYRYLDIGTAKPSVADRERFPHHLIDIVDPDQPFSAGEWVSKASDTVRDILRRGKLPIISGGTGFYIKAFQEGLSEEMASDQEIRAGLDQELAESSPAAMHDRLTSIDPDRAAELAVNDTVRIIRALEVYYSGGTTFTEARKARHLDGGDYRYLTIGVSMPREQLYSRINERVDAMVDAGLLNELKAVLANGYSRELVSLDTVGYKEWFPMLDGESDFEDCLEAVKRNTRRYAKRQMTWFRGRKGIQWVDVSEKESIAAFFETVAAFPGQDAS